MPQGIPAAAIHAPTPSRGGRHISNAAAPDSAVRSARCAGELAPSSSAECAAFGLIIRIQVPGILPSVVPGSVAQVQCLPLKNKFENCHRTHRFP